MMDFRAQCREDLTQLEEKISAMQRALISLGQEKERLQDVIDECSIILHPMRRLPTDILEEIFLSSNGDLQAEDKGWSGPSSLDSHQIPWRISQVSSRWRSVALALPRLWSYVRIIIGLGGSDVLPAHISQQLAFYLAAQLHRSTSHPLSVTLYSACREVSSSNSLLQILLPTSPRWKRLTLHCLSPFRNVLSSMVGSFEDLQTLHLTISIVDVLESDDESSLLALDIFQTAPTLRTVTMSPQTLRSCKLPLSQITRYQFHYEPSISIILGALTLMPNLQSLSGLLCTSVEPTNPLFILELERLRSLYLASFVPCDYGLLKHLSLPSLQYLDISCGTFPSPMSKALLDMIDRSQCSITKLRVSSLSFSDDTCLHLLKGLPTIQTLILQCPKASTLKFITTLCDQTNLVPSLKQLALYPSFAAKFDYRLPMQELKRIRSDLIPEVWVYDPHSRRRIIGDWGFDAGRHLNSEYCSLYSHSLAQFKQQRNRYR